MRFVLTTTKTTPISGDATPRRRLAKGVLVNPGSRPQEVTCLFARRTRITGFAGGNVKRLRNVERSVNVKSYGIRRSSSEYRCELWLVSRKKT